MTDTKQNDVKIYGHLWYIDNIPAVVKWHCRSAITRARCIDKYPPKHEVNMATKNGQAGRAPDSQWTNKSLIPKAQFERFKQNYQIHI